MPSKQSPVGSTTNTPPCRYCDGKGTYSIQEDPRIGPEIRPCKRCNGTGKTPKQPPIGPFVPADQEINNFARPTSPEEKEKTLGEKLIAHTEEMRETVSGWWARDEVEDLFHERDAIHSKHYARIEGEKEDLVRGLKRVLKDLKNGYIPYPGAVTVPDIIEDFVRGLIAKHTNSSPQGK